MVTDITYGAFKDWPANWTSGGRYSNYAYLDSRGSFAYLKSNSTYDMTNYAKLNLTCLRESDTSNGRIYLQVLDQAGNVVKSAQHDFGASPQRATVSLDLDVSSLVGSYYIRFAVQRTAGRYSVELKAPVSLTAK